MKNSISYRLVILLPVPLLIALANCHKEFDEPPVYTGTAVTANMTIRSLRNMHTTGSHEQVLSDEVIEGIVIANDSQDNFYKSIVIQDSTGGITVRMDGFSLHHTYPVGRKLYIRLKGLWLGDYGKMIQLGAGVDKTNPASPELTAIPQPVFDRHIVKGSLNNEVIPKQVTMDELTDSMQSRLIVINNVEFAVADTGRTYADAVNKLATNHTLKTCGGGSLYVRTGGFAKFAALRTPRGNGSITGIYSVFRTEKQLLIRDTADVRMNGLRCTGTGYRVLLNEDFESVATDAALGLAGWKNIAEAGDRKYLGKRSADNSYAELSAFATNQPSVITWLITPAINLNNTTNEVLSFVTKDGFDNGARVQALISTNYDGGNTPWKAKWTPLAAAVAKGSVSGFRPGWLSSGNIQLHGFSGNVSIAFRYEGNDPSDPAGKHTSTFQLDNVKITGN
ncbi:MAG: hypothetical protein NVSMB63_16900 [Sediminibacterium sp.]